MQPNTIWIRRAQICLASQSLIALMLVAGCGSEPTALGDAPFIPAPPRSPNAPSTPTGTGPLLISGVMTAQRQSVRVSRGGVGVTDAAVTVNGIPIPHYAGDLYSGNLPSEAAVGSTLFLKVVAYGVTFEGSGEVGATPAITAPVNGSSLSHGDPVMLAWSQPTDPGGFSVCVNCWENSLDGVTHYVAADAREYKIRSGELVDYGTGAVVAIYAFTSNFLKAPSSSDVSSNVEFMARSRDAIIHLDYNR